MQNRLCPAELIQKAQEVIRAKNILAQFLNRLDLIFNQLNNHLIHTDYELFKNETLSKINSWVSGFYNKEKSATIFSSFETIEKEVTQFKNYFEKFKKLSITPGTFEKNNFSNELIKMSTSISARMNAIASCLVMIEEIIKKNYANSKDYEMAFLAFPENINLNNEASQKKLLEISEQKGNIPIAIKQGNKIYLFGHKKSEWILTELTEQVFSEINFSLLEHEVQATKSIKKEIYEEIKGKRAHTHSHLGRKLEIYRNGLTNIHAELTHFISGLQFYVYKEANHFFKFRQIGNKIINIFQENQTLLKLITDNESAIADSQSLFLNINKNLATLTRQIISLKEQPEYLNTDNFLKLTQIEKSIRSTQEQLVILNPLLDHSIKLLEEKKTLFGQNVNHDLSDNDYQNINFFIKFMENFELDAQTIIQLCNSNIEKNIIDIFNTILITVDKASMIENVHHFLEQIHVILHANLISMKQTMNLVNPLSINTNSLVSEINLLHFNLKTKQQSPPPLLIFNNGRKKMAIIEPSETYSVEETKQGLSSPLSPADTDDKMIRQKSRLDFLKNQITQRLWQISGWGEKGELIDNETKKKSTMRLTLHANKMLIEINALEKSQTKTTAAYDQTIDKITEINKQSCTYTSFFRKNSTAIAYNRIRNDLQETRLIAKYSHANETIKEIETILDKATKNSILAIELNTYLQMLHSKNYSSKLKLIQFYQFIKNNVYNKKIIITDKKICHHLLSLICHIDIYESLNNIKNQIIENCIHKNWSTFLSKQSITLNSIRYSVPAHVKEIWQLIQTATRANDNNENELHFIEPNQDQLLTAYSNIMNIAEREAFNPTLTRYQNTHHFYIDILTNQYVNTKMDLNFLSHPS